MGLKGGKTDSEEIQDKNRTLTHIRPKGAFKNQKLHIQHSL